MSSRMDLAESSAVKDMELRSLSREVAGLRATAAGRAVGLSSAREAMAAAVAAAAVAVEAVGGTGDDEDGAGAGTKDEERDVEGVGRQRNESEGRHLEYDEQEQSFLLVDDSEEDEDDDEDEEWLPGERNLLILVNEIGDGSFAAQLVYPWWDRSRLEQGSGIVYEYKLVRYCNLALVRFSACCLFE